jgi:enoyl-CoA hydratase/carnithine racemase
MPSAEEQIKIDIGDGILTMQINRPEKKNALTPAMYVALAEGLIRADNDRDVRVILISGGDACFTAGNDLADFLETPPVDADSPVMQFLLTLSATRKPIVAAVNGVAVGVGTTMLLHCELVVAAEDARFQMPFVNLGLCAEAGSTLLLPRLVGHQQAAELILLGEPFSAGKALQCGLVNRVVPAAEVQETALALARRLADQPPQALQLTKQLMKSSDSLTVREKILEEGRHFGALLRAPEARESLRAFMERRKPDFSTLVH